MTDASELITPEVLRSVRNLSESVSFRTGFNVDADELFSVGQTALVESAQRYDDRSGANFTSYSRVRVRGAMQDYLRDIDPTPRRVRAAVRQIRQKPEAEWTAEDRATLSRVCSVVYTDAQFNGYLDGQLPCEGVGDTRQRNIELLMPALGKLDAVQQFVLWQSVVGNAFDSRIAVFLDVSNTRVGQLRESALAKLRVHFLEAENLEEQFI